MSRRCSAYRDPHAHTLPHTVHAQNRRLLLYNKHLCVCVCCCEQKYFMSTSWSEWVACLVLCFWMGIRCSVLYSVYVAVCLWEDFYAGSIENIFRATKNKLIIQRLYIYVKYNDFNEYLLIPYCCYYDSNVEYTLFFFTVRKIYYICMRSKKKKKIRFQIF